MINQNSRREQRPSLQSPGLSELQRLFLATAAAGIRWLLSWIVKSGFLWFLLINWWIHYFTRKAKTKQIAHTSLNHTLFSVNSPTSTQWSHCSPPFEQARQTENIFLSPTLANRFYFGGSRILSYVSLVAWRQQVESQRKIERRNVSPLCCSGTSRV